jgi:hypothetical protein
VTALVTRDSDRRSVGPSALRRRTASFLLIHQFCGDKGTLPHEHEIQRPGMKEVSTHGGLPSTGQGCLNRSYQDGGRYGTGRGRTEGEPRLLVSISLADYALALRQPNPTPSRIRALASSSFSGHSAFRPLGSPQIPQPYITDHRGGVIRFRRELQAS